VSPRTASVLGATGLIGRRLLHALRARGGEAWAVSGTGHQGRLERGLAPLDVTDPTALEAHLALGFDEVVVAAGTKDVAGCEADPARAVALNAAPVRTVLEAVRRGGLATRVTFLSTDYVFDGARGAYRAEEAPAPRTAYGRSRWLGEQAVLEAGPPHLVVRSGGVLGRGAHFLDWLVAALASGREVRLFADCFNSPTPLQLLADLLAEVVTAPSGPERVLHLVGDRRLSRLQLGQLVARLVGADPAALVPEARGAGGPLFQADLSLVPSALAQGAAGPGFEERLRAELAVPAGAPLG
jgi:dTDP-4-dehydrorhamnose reductase